MMPSSHQPIVGANYQPLYICGIAETTNILRIEDFKIKHKVYLRRYLADELLLYAVIYWFVLMVDICTASLQVSICRLLF